MTDREKVAEGLEYLITAYAFHCDDAQCLGDAIELLKEQEPVKPIENAGFYYCGACKYAFTSGRQKFCSDCGRAVKWDECSNS